MAHDDDDDDETRPSNDARLSVVSLRNSSLLFLGNLQSFVRPSEKGRLHVGAHLGRYVASCKYAVGQGVHDGAGDGGARLLVTLHIRVGGRVDGSTRGKV